MSTTAAESAPTLVTSADGTQIAVFVSGDGRPVILVPGTSADHTTWRLVAPLLAPHFAMHAVDRRGRGASGDSPRYALAREYEDVAAVVDATVSRWGAPVDLIGHSYGGNVAFGAALLTSGVRRLVLYEGWPMPDLADRTTSPEVLARLDDLLASGQREKMMEAFFRLIVHYTDDEIATVKSAPSWPGRIDSAHTVPREIRAFGEHAFDPAVAAGVGIPVLLLVGGESPEAIRGRPREVAAALPDARIVELEGQGHMANITAPELTARVLREFLAD